MFLFFQCLENSVVEVDVDAVEAFGFNGVDGIRPAVLRPSDSFQGLETNGIGVRQDDGDF